MKVYNCELKKYFPGNENVKKSLANAIMIIIIKCEKIYHFTRNDIVK